MNQSGFPETIQEDSQEDDIHDSDPNYNSANTPKKDNFMTKEGKDDKTDPDLVIIEESVDSQSLNAMLNNDGLKDNDLLGNDLLGENLQLETLSDVKSQQLGDYFFEEAKNNTPSHKDQDMGNLLKDDVIFDS